MQGETPGVSVHYVNINEFTILTEAYINYNSFINHVQCLIHHTYPPPPLQRTLHPTGPIPDTSGISTLACNINPAIPQNIIQKSRPNSSGLILAPPSTSVVSFLFPLALHNTSPYQFHRPSQWSHSLALPTLHHQSYQYPQLDLSPLSHLPCLAF